MIKDDTNNELLGRTQERRGREISYERKERERCEKSSEKKYVEKRDGRKERKRERREKGGRKVILGYRGSHQDLRSYCGI